MTARSHIPPGPHTALRPDAYGTRPGLYWQLCTGVGMNLRSTPGFTLPPDMGDSKSRTAVWMNQTPSAPLAPPWVSFFMSWKWVKPAP